MGLPAGFVILHVESPVLSAYVTSAPPPPSPPTDDDDGLSGVVIAFGIVVPIIIFIASAAALAYRSRLNGGLRIGGIQFRTRRGGSTREITIIGAEKPPPAAFVRGVLLNEGCS